MAGFVLRRVYDFQMRIVLISLAAWLAAILSFPVSALTVPSGSSQQVVELGELTLVLHTYRPDRCEPRAWLIVFHGESRNADQYRDYAKPLADGLCAVVVAPAFDKRRFSNATYQRGGLTNSDLEKRPGTTVERLVEVLRAGEPNAWPYAVIGHSAGAQFLSRYAAATPNQARAIVLANAGSYVFPTLETQVPDGFAGLPDADAALQRYLAEPIVVLLGKDDVHRTRNLPRGYDDQGSNRYERGLNFFHAGERYAAEKGYPFNWRLLEVPGVAHEASGMFNSTQAFQAVRDATPK